jgi:hopanoid biosynthesis associated radical SAM protein HpnH
MPIPILQQYRVARYILGQKLHGRARYPLVLMLEPLFQCNLACAGCGKIDYPEDILRRRMSVAQALGAVAECGAPIVSIAGGEPLIHKELPEIVRGILAMRRFVYLCTNALLLDARIDDYSPSPYLTFSIHLDGLRERHDAAVCRAGVFDQAIDTIRMAVSRGFRVNVNCTLYADEKPAEVARFLDFTAGLGVEGITLSPGYSYDHAPRQDVFLGRRQSRTLFREVFRLGREGRRRWPFNHSWMYLDFLAGNQSYQCTPWSNPTYNIFGWQRPCYLLVDEGHAGSLRELLDTTPWERYGSGRHPKCNSCMAHCGYEGTAVNDMFAHPLNALRVAARGPRTSGPMAPEPPELPAAPPAVNIPIAAIGGRHVTGKR